MSPDNKLRLQDAADATMEVAKTFNEKISKYCLVTLDSCAYAGTGNVLKVCLPLVSSMFCMSLSNFSGCIL